MMVRRKRVVFAGSIREGSRVQGFERFKRIVYKVYRVDKYFQTEDTLDTYSLYILKFNSSRCSRVQGLRFRVQFFGEGSVMI